jgi:hypothetical protein
MGIRDVAMDELDILVLDSLAGPLERAVEALWADFGAWWSRDVHRALDFWLTGFRKWADRLRAVATDLSSTRATRMSASRVRNYVHDTYFGVSADRSSMCSMY